MPLQQRQEVQTLLRHAGRQTLASNPEPARAQSTPEVFTDGCMEIDGKLHSLANLKPPE